MKLQEIGVFFLAYREAVEMKRILISTEKRDDIAFFNTFFAGEEGYSTQNAMDPDAALHRVRAWKPHLVFLNEGGSDLTWLDLIPKIRALPHDTYTSIILLSEGMTIENLKKGYELGADYFLEGPFDHQGLLACVHSGLKLKEANDALKRTMHRIEELTSTDELTGLLNMRAAYRKGEKEIVQGLRLKRPVSLLWVDLDCFSDLNRNCSFTFGNFVLQEVGLLLRQCLRSIDFVARIGGDEFLVFLSETDLANAEAVAERIRNLIQFKQFKNDRFMAKLTTSIGVAGIDPEHKNQKMDDLLRMAAEALKSAKANGDNQIEIYSFT